MKSYYTQCKLSRDNTTTVAWIPSRFAVVGHRVTIKDDGEWTVIEKYAKKLAEHVEEHEADYRKQRKASDL